MGALDPLDYNKAREKLHQKCDVSDEFQVRS